MWAPTPSAVKVRCCVSDHARFRAIAANSAMDPPTPAIHPRSSQFGAELAHLKTGQLWVSASSDSLAKSRAFRQTSSRSDEPKALPPARLKASFRIPPIPNDQQWVATVLPGLANCLLPIAICRFSKIFLLLPLRAGRE